MRWSLILLQYNFFILYLLSKQNESRCSIETEAECVNESLRWQSTTLYNADNTFWDDKQAYTDCLNDSSRHISLCACTRSELVQWDHRPQTDVSECWSRRWVIQWALSDNSQETKIIFYCFKSEVFITKCFLSDEEKLLLWKTLSVVIRTLCTELIQYTHDSTMTEHSERDVTDALYHNSSLTWECYRMSVHSVKLWQMLYKQQLKRPWQGFWSLYLYQSRFDERYSLTL
jgi:hypothetical protein